jgi:AcrR family transcriptional regulator
MAEAAGVSEVTLFRKYGKKSQLVTRAINAIIAQTDLDTAAEYSGDVKADLAHVVKTYSDSAVEHGQFFAVLLAEMRRHPEITELVNAPFNIFQRFASLLVRYQGEGVLKDEPPLHALAALLGPVIYTSLISNAFPEAAIPPLNIDTHVNNFLEGRQSE